MHDARRPPIHVSMEVHVSAVEFIRNSQLVDKAGLARFAALAMLAGASGFILAIILA